ncbi:MAG: hypothetical protein JWO47_551 [Candidatus Saccharibacteria bacterium]|nr:hypothetical protein [Candidatus Saccharibacteria bacterium]
MTIQELFIMANQELEKVILQIKDDQWSMMMPPGMSRSPGNLELAVRYHTYDDAWVPDVLAGKTAEEVGDKYDYVKTEGDILKNYKKYNYLAVDAVAGFTDLDKQTHLSYGDYPAKDYLQHIISFRAFRSYDIAKMIGIDSTMKPDFVEALTEEYTPVIGFYRQIGVFPEPLEVAENASAQEKLLAMVGRS